MAENNSIFINNRVSFYNIHCEYSFKILINKYQEHLKVKRIPKS